MTPVTVQFIDTGEALAFSCLKFGNWSIGNLDFRCLPGSSRNFLF